LSPPPAPSRVTLAAPVVAQFEAVTLLGVGPTNVNTSDVLPAEIALVSPTRHAQKLPLGDLQRAELDDVQTVASPRLADTRKRAVKSDSPATPALAPSSVTLAAPVVAQFDASTLLGVGP
jgi:hypothetical protein